MSHRNKPGIPPVPKAGESRVRFDASLKEALETIMGRREGPTKDIYRRPNGWNDLLTSIITRTTGAGTPAYNVFQGATRGYQFAVGDAVYGSFHITHDYAPGTAVYPHIHWSADSTDTDTVTWRWTWSYARGYGIDGFSAPQTVDVTQAHCGIQYGHNIAETTDAQALLITNCETDGLINWAVELNAKTLGVNPFAFFVDLHYQSDGRLTVERNRTFTKVKFEDDLVGKVNEILDVMQ